VGIRYQLNHHGSSTEGSIVYRGRIDGDIRCAIEVVVAPGDSSGAAGEVVARAPDAPAERRRELERVAAVMVRSAVRRAEREGLPPPRRIQRWRER
jgi:hypothetical protein